MKKTELLVPEVSFDDDGADFAAILTRKLHINRTTIKIESAGGIDSWGEIPKTKCQCGHSLEMHTMDVCFFEYPSGLCPCNDYIPINKEEK